ncbi:helix-turn-helix domain-containing protein [Shouchella lehensis]|uniref:Cryptic phage CTXphi transcriptional repressor rstR n=1 Tax=Shouchella lehensis G1 TaxID=1246626 RepID=A0A060M6C1_9BACI|nr:helix-turn-helix transcriptional regulator [Shouchella lehensis]AIC96088.1 Cryptic phage CTXphi transcriptional repressor rstR [Shouchella lehensis G1]
MANFQERLKSLKNESSTSYQELAEYLGISLRAVQHYASGARTPDLEGLIKIADFYEVSIDYLVGRSDERERS